MKLKRREFLKVSAAATAGLALSEPPAVAEVRNGMPYRVLGKTGEKVSLLCLGGYHIGNDTLTDDESVRLIRTAVDEGVNFLDNAWIYHDGLSETRMGKALKDGYRDKVFLMTKLRHLDAQGAEKDLEDSLRRLQTDVIDLWQFHEIVKPDEPEKVYSEGALDFALKAKEQGKVRYIGFTGHKSPKIHAEMIDRGFDWDTVQMPLNVCDHHFNSFEREILPKALEKQMGVIGMKSLAGTPGRIPQSGVATVKECMTYTMNLPISALASGMDSMEILKTNLAIAKSFKPIPEEEVTALLKRTETIAAEGELETFKTSWGKA